MGVVLFLFGVYDFQVVMTGSSYYIGQVYGIMFTWCMLFLPALTMKTLSEDRKNKTDQALITAPVSVTAIVWGKFLSAFTVYLITLAITLIPAFIIGAFSDPTWSHIFGNFVASLLYGAAIIAIGVFISSLTESQIVALVGTVGVSILLMLIDSFGSMLGQHLFPDGCVLDLLPGALYPLHQRYFQYLQRCLFRERRRGVQFPDRPQARKQKMELKGGIKR